MNKFPANVNKLNKTSILAILVVCLGNGAKSNSKSDISDILLIKLLNDWIPAFA
jgi:hypothetical protein